MIRVLSFAAGALAMCAGAAAGVLDTTPVPLRHTAIVMQEAQPADAAAPAEAAEPQPTSIFEGWTGTLEAGLNGSTGNSETLNLRAGATANRKTAQWDTNAALTYARATDDGRTTKNRFEARLRNDYSFQPDSRWLWYTVGNYEYDDFQRWRHRLQLGTGLGYRFIKNEKTTLTGRGGVNVVKEFDTTDQRWRPELNLGADLEHSLTDRQKLTATVDFFKSLIDGGDFRVVARAAYEILVDPESKLTLRLGAENRYDSSVTSPTKKNDLDYFAMLVWGF